MRVIALALHLFGTDRVILHEIAEGLSVFEGGRVDSLVPLLSANLISGERRIEAGVARFINVRLTRSGAACLIESRQIASLAASRLQAGALPQSQ